MHLSDAKPCELLGSGMVDLFINRGQKFAAVRQRVSGLRDGRRILQAILRPVQCVLLLSIVGACGLPRSGPYYHELTSAEQPEEYRFHVLPMTAQIAMATTIDERRGFSAALTSATAAPVHRLAPGDTVAITVWENIDEGLLSPTGVGGTLLPKSRIDERGRIFVPYIGLVPAAGRTMGELRRIVEERLADQTLNPQVHVAPVDAGGRMVSVQGVVKAPGLYPIEPPTIRILSMMARAGGVSLDPEIVRLKLRRGHVQSEIWLSDLYDDPGNDVHLRAGDAIIAERDRRIFTALGAVNGSATVQFPTRDLSVVRALGAVGGLHDASADPTGVFLFRVEPPETARKILTDRNVKGPQRIAYVFDLTQPAGLFLARDFKMRDRDTIYVTTAPFVRWLKILQSVAPLVNFSASARTLGGF